MGRVRWTAPLALVALLAAMGGAPLPVSPLVEAARHARWAEVKALLGKGAQADEAGNDGSTALLWAAWWDELPAAEMLLKAGAKVNAANDLGATALWAAAQNGSPAMTKRLLDAGADPNAKLLLGETVLMAATRVGNAATVDLLLKKGADPKPHAGRGQTALMWAAAQSHPDIVRLLLQHGADVHAVDSTYDEVMAVPPHGEPENRKDIPHGKYTALMFAARVGDLASAKLLVDAGSSVNDADAWGVSTVTLAAHSGFDDFVAYLLAKGADPNQDGAGFTALHVAIMRRDTAMVRDLLAHGANPNAPLATWTPTRRASNDWNFHQALVGATPYWLAARFDEPDMMRMLAAKGADAKIVHHPDYVAAAAGPYDSGRAQGSLTTVMAAVGMGAGSAWVDPPGGQTPKLMLETIQLALDQGVDVNAKNTDGQTALDQATSRRMQPVVDYLIAHGATPPDPSATPRRGGRGGGAPPAGGAPAPN